MNSMRRREFVSLLGGATASWPVGPLAQQKQTPVIGFLAVGSADQSAPAVGAFHEGLKDAGWIVGQNVAIEYRWADGHFERLPALVADLVKRKVDVLATNGGTAAALAAKSASSTIPIVFEVGIDPVARGLVASFARPGGNLTGVAILTGELNPKRIDLLSELVPQASVIGLLVNSNNPLGERTIREIEEAARSKGVQLQVVKAGAEGEFETAFASLVQLRVGALLVGNDPYFFSQRGQLVELAARHAIPAMYEWREFVVQGGLASYGASITGMYRQFGAHVGRVLKGEKPADLPILRPTKFELVINARTAKTLSLSIPPTFLGRADEVIE
jgi:putative ABC transport system substrate-binding protein